MDTVNWKDWLTEEEQEALALTEKMGELLYGGIRPGVIRLFRSLAASRAQVADIKKNVSQAKMCHNCGGD